MSWKFSNFPQHVYVLEKWKECPGMSWNVLEFEFQKRVVTMLQVVPNIDNLLKLKLFFLLLDELSKVVYAFQCTISLTWFDFHCG